MAKFQSKEVYFDKLRKEKVYIASDLDQVDAGLTTNMHIKNPVGSGKSVVIQDIRVNGHSKGIAEIHDGFSVAPSGGTTQTVQNGLLDSAAEADEGFLEVKTNVTFTEDSTHAVATIGGGVGGNSVGASSEYATLVLQEGREVVIEVTNTSSNNNQYYAITAIMYEINR